MPEIFVGAVSVIALLINIVKVIAVVIIGNIVIKTVQKLVEKSPLDETVTRFLKPVVKVVVYFIVVMIICSMFGIDTSSILALAGVFSAAIALACQGLLSNMFGGLIMLATKPFVVGDYISAAGFEGSVQEIGLFVTTILTVDNKTIRMPNGVLSSSTLTNYTTQGHRRVDIAVQASYDSDVKVVKGSLLKAVEMTANVDIEKADPFIRLSGYGEHAIDYVVRIWCKSENYWQVYFDLLENIKIAFDEDGVIMTYPHINVHTVKDEA